MKNFKIRNSISIKLLKIVFIIYFSITIVMTLIHVIAEYQHTKSAVQEEIYSLENTFEAPLAKAMWNFDLPQRKLLTSSMYDLEIITGLRVISKENQIIDNLGETSNSKELTHTFNIIEFFDNKPHFLAKVELYSSSEIVFDRVKIGFLFIFISAIIKSTILLFLLIWAFHKFLTKPINELSQKLQDIDLENIENSELFKSKPRQKNSDELELFRDNFSFMLNNINKSKQELLEQEKLLFEHSKKAAMGDFIGIIAHQLKQPLNSIKLLSHSLNDSYQYEDLTKEDFEKTHKMINSKISFMATSIDNLRNFFKPNKVPKPFLVKDAIESAISLIEVQLSGRGIYLEVTNDKDLVINGFENDLQQVILNMLNNSKEAIIETQPESAFVKLRSQMIEGNIVITVEDNGGGIPETIIQNIFDSHFTTKGEEGSGLGLHLAKMIIEESMNGKLFVENRKNGAIFTIVIGIERS